MYNGSIGLAEQKMVFHTIITTRPCYKFQDFTNTIFYRIHLTTAIIKTRMRTSISSEAWRNQTSILMRGQEKHVPPLKPDRQTYRRTDIRMDISIYRVASLLKIATWLTIYLNHWNWVNRNLVKAVQLDLPKITGSAYASPSPLINWTFTAILRALSPLRFEKFNSRGYTYSTFLNII